MRLAPGEAALLEDRNNGVAGGGGGGGISERKGTAAGPPDNATLMLEGALCPEYYAVRDLLYSQYHIC